jgi:cysteine synthase
MARRGRKLVTGASRRNSIFAPIKYPGLLEALDAFEGIIQILLHKEGYTRPLTVLRESVPGFGSEEVSAWRTNLDRGNALSQARRMITALESAIPTRGADEDVDKVWMEDAARHAAKKLIQRLRQYCDDVVEAQTQQLLTTRRGELTPAAVDPAFSSENPSVYSWAKMKVITDNIYVPAQETPLNPEFPPDSPRFPATPTIPVEIEGRVVLVKDESKNPTGTHKDRWAWEMIVRYKNWFEKQESDLGSNLRVPRYSMISSGSAAIALQSLLRTRLLPDLRVVMDLKRTDDRIISRLESLGAKTYLVNLDDHPLSQAEVLAITDNVDGYDVTPRHADEPFDNRYYDWLAYELLNEHPRHIYVPFGAGGLFANVIYVIHAERMGRRDPRLQIDPSELVGVNVYGATSEDPQTRMHMLYARFRPTRSGIDQAVADFIKMGTLGERSGIFAVTDDEARHVSSALPGCGIRTDLSGVAGLALYVAKAPSVPPGEKILVVNTGCVYFPSS